MNEVSVAEALPAGPPLTEAQQIGRSGARDSLHERLVDGAVVFLMEPRRVGKTSLARAALTRIARNDGVTGELQLTSYADPQLAAADLARQLVGGLDRVVEPSRRLLDRLRAVGLPEDVGDGGPVLVDLANALLGEARGLPAVLAHCIDHLPEGRSAAVLLDEAHVIAEWPAQLQRALCTLLRANSRLGVVIASSETRALEGLVGPGGALEYAGYRFELPPIAIDDWCSGLTQRLTQLGLCIQDELLRELVGRAGAHPYRTMRLAQEAARVARSVPSTETPGEIDAGDLQAALLAVRGDPAWEALA